MDKENILGVEFKKAHSQEAYKLEEKYMVQISPILNFKNANYIFGCRVYDCDLCGADNLLAFGEGYTKEEALIIVYRKIQNNNIIIPGGFLEDFKDIEDNYIIKDILE